MKMLKVVVFALFALLLVAVRAVPLHQTEQIQIIALEEECVRQGGLCVLSDECEPGNTPTPQLGAALCPKQRHLGVTCCYM